MKKVYIIIAILASLVLSAMFIGIGYGMSRISTPKVVYKEIPTVAPTPTPEPEVEYIYPRWEPGNIDELKKNPPKPVTERVYINYERGYKFTFPEEWMGWILVDDSDPGNVKVCFYGQSDASRYGEYDYYDGSYGMLLFYIEEEKATGNYAGDGKYDYIDEIGSARGKKYYWHSVFSSPGLLKDAGRTDYYDEEERNRAREDEKKLNSMLIRPRFLFETFEEIK